MIKTISLLSFLCFGLVFSGCSTTSNISESNIARFAAVAEVAAYTGSSVYLLDHPEDKAKFVTVSEQLDILLSDKPTLIRFLEIVNLLPVKELKSSKGVLVVNSSIILFGAFAPEIQKLEELEQANKLRPIIISLKRGIDLAVK